MRIAEVIGTVTLSRAHPALVGARWLIGVPFSLQALREGSPDGEDLVIFDELGAGGGSRIGFGHAGRGGSVSRFIRRCRDTKFLSWSSRCLISKRQH